MIPDRVMKCPKCGTPIIKVEDVFPTNKDVNAKSESHNVESGSYVKEYNEEQNENKKGWLRVLLVLLLCLLCGGYYAYTKFYNYNNIGAIAKSANSAASNEINEIVEGNKEVDRNIRIDAAISFIEDFYNKEKYIDYDFLRKHCTDQVLKKLRDDYDYDTEEPGYAIWQFRSDAQDGPNDRHEIISVTPLEDDWFLYTFYDMGNKGSCKIKVVPNDDGEFIIAGVVAGKLDDSVRSNNDSENDEISSAGLTFRTFTKKENDNGNIFQFRLDNEEIAANLKELGFEMIDKTTESRPDYTGEEYYEVTIETYSKTVNGYVTTVKLESDYTEIHFPNISEVEEFKKTVRACGLNETEDGFKDSEDVYWAGTDVSVKGTIVTLTYRWEA